MVGVIYYKWTLRNAIKSMFIFASICSGVFLYIKLKNRPYTEANKMCEYCEVSKPEETNDDGDICIMPFTRNDYREEEYYESTGMMGDPIMFLNPKNKQLISLFDDCIESMIHIKFCPFCGRELEVGM